VRIQYLILKIKILDSNIAHEATTSKISEEQLHYCQQRGLNSEEAVGLIVNGFCKKYYNNYQWSLQLRHKNLWASA